MEDSRPTADETARTPEHPRVRDETARAIVHSLLESDGVGVALIRGNDFTHVMTSPRYEQLVGKTGTLGMNVYDVLPETVAPRGTLEQVAATGLAGTSLQPLVRREGSGLSAVRIHVAFSFLRVRRVTPSHDGVLVVARDVSAEIHQTRVATLFRSLANEMAEPRDDEASVRATVLRGRTALGADATSIFLLSPDGRQLHGALVGWDWTRTSFDADVDAWPNVRDAICANAASYVTAKTAARSEREWFERQGIRAAICAPMCAGDGVLGVLFFDYTTSTPPPIDTALAKEIADRCALFIHRLG